MLINTQQEIKDLIGSTNGLSFERLEPFIRYVETQYIKKILGSALYLKLDANNNLSAEETKLLVIANLANAHLAFFHYLEEGGLIISDSGIHNIATEYNKTASFGQIKDIRRTTAQKAYSAIDEIYLYLEKNQDNFADWVSSDSYTEYNSLLVRNYKDFNNCVNIPSRLTYVALIQKLKYVETFHLTFLCDGYLAELRTELKAGNLSTANKVIVPLLQNFIARKSLEFGIDSLHIEVSVFGVKKDYSTDSINTNRPAEQTDRDLLKKQWNDEADMYKNKIIATLIDNIADYPTYQNSDCYDSETATTDSIDNDPIKEYDSFLRT